MRESLGNHGKRRKIWDKSAIFTGIIYIGTVQLAMFDGKLNFIGSTTFASLFLMFLCCLYGCLVGCLQSLNKGTEYVSGTPPSKAIYPLVV